MNKTRILYLFTRTPLHVGAGSSVGAIDQPIIRERHTGFPVIPATTLKGVFADQWTEIVFEKKKDKDDKETDIAQGKRNADEGVWLFGSEDANNAAAGALQFSEAKLLAFPIRSAKGSFAWITCPLILRRAAREGVLDAAKIPAREPLDGEAIVATNSSVLLPSNQVVLEEYTFMKAEGDAGPVAADLKGILNADAVWKEVASRLVIVSDGMMSFFAQSACEVAQHVAIDRAKGTAKPSALFNQENVPSEAMFFAVLNCFQERRKQRNGDKALRGPEEAAAALKTKLDGNGRVFQFGGDASTGLGFCTVELKNNAK
ncbi:MAG: type III-B CRISPR module RAMP protein Cmr4 [Betaproteobacteria bacterium]|nr:type III-B CRISPR module RAMP protein Cmr4 [Betaproteobacteria bacterium]